MAFVLIISGSPGPDSCTEVVADHVTRGLVRADHSVCRLTVRELPTVALLTADLTDPEVRRALDLVDRADGIVVATPVYRAAHSGLVQALFNLLGETALAGKVILPLANGGSQGHLVAIDYALRPLLAARGAGQVVDGHFVPDSAVRDGRLTAAAAGALDAATGHFAEAVGERSGRSGLASAS